MSDLVCAEAADFDELYGPLQRRMGISGRSQTTPKNFTHDVPKTAFHFQVVPTETDKDHI